MTVDKTYVPKGLVETKWVLVDANDQGLGRLATIIAQRLMGKHRPDFTPGVEMGDFVVVINAERLRLTNKRMDEKIYYHSSMYPGGMKSVGLRTQMRIHPDRVIRAAVWGMIPHTKLGRQLIKRLKIYAGNEHPHAAQDPETMIL
jgi:large subunit ribosomal protein L13